MITILLIVLLVLAFGGFGHTGYRRGWYGGYNRMGGTPATGGWAGGGLGVFLLVIVLILLLTGSFHTGP